MEEDRCMEEVAKEFLQKPVKLSDVESNNDEADQLREEYFRKKRKLQDCLLSARSWRDLPPEILTEIADNFGIIDLLGFRGVCTNWRSASFLATAAIEYAPDTHPYFLLYNDEDEECILVNPTNDKKYTLNIPELKEATCLASSHSWLLLSQKGLIFFFCPFSHVRIDLPPFQESEISKGSAAFTSSLLSNDCVTALIRRKRHKFLELHVLERGDSAWVKYEYDLSLRFFCGVKGATFADECFQILDENDKMITFDLGNKSFEYYKIVKERRDPNIESLPFNYKEKCFSKSDFRKRMKLGNDVAISICAAYYAGSGDSVIFVKNEKFKAILDYDAQEFKGVWIQPRFFQLPPNYSW
ncbi:f-box protein [Nicotiana attenuata]|uniref:F-box protein n=1 Tax=Nicotiana attenuata TaxID=49451 RepID=A0A1J6HUE4_NICAT|nr:f-box protein [Nicotiana attenuata]